MIQLFNIGVRGGRWLWNLRKVAPIAKLGKSVKGLAGYLKRMKAPLIAGLSRYRNVVSTKLSPTLSKLGTGRLAKLKDLAKSPRGRLVGKILNYGLLGYTAYEIVSALGDKESDEKDRNAAAAIEAKGIDKLEQDISLLRDITNMHAEDEMIWQGMVAHNNERSYLLRTIAGMLEDRRLHSEASLSTSNDDRVKLLSFDDKLYAISLLNACAKRLASSADEHVSPLLDAFRVQCATSSNTLSLPTRALQVAYTAIQQGDDTISAACAQYVENTSAFSDEMSASALDDFYNSGTSTFDIVNPLVGVAAINNAIAKSQAEHTAYITSSLATDVKLVVLDGFYDRWKVDDDGKDDETAVLSYLYQLQRPISRYSEYVRSVQVGNDSTYNYANTIKDL